MPVRLPIQPADQHGEPKPVTMGVSVYAPRAGDADALHESMAAKPLLVVGLCAAWCNTCAEFSAGFERIAASRQDATFVWLDIEDDAHIAGDIDVENFPTIGVWHRKRLLHFGVSLPQPAVLSRLLDALSAASRTVEADVAVVQLPDRLEAERG